MWMRIFRVRVPVDLHQEFEVKFIAISIPAVLAQAGIISVNIGRPTQWAPEEYVMLSVWESELALQNFAGPNWSTAVIPPGMEKFVMECWVHHYENFS